MVNLVCLVKDEKVLERLAQVKDLTMLQIQNL